MNRWFSNRIMRKSNVEMLDSLPFCRHLRVPTSIATSAISVLRITASITKMNLLMMGLLASVEIGIYLAFSQNFIPFCEITFIESTSVTSPYWIVTTSLGKYIKISQEIYVASLNM